VVDLNQRVEELIGLLGRLIGEGVAVTWIPGGGLWPIRVDTAQLDQVLTNLVVNARDAMEGTGTLTVATANVSRAATDESPAADYVQLVVSDTGTGMDDSTRARIFEPFFTTKPHGQGTGLGLATVYGVVRQHGGVVEVESTPGQGASFRVLWPRSSDEVEPAAEHAVVDPVAGGGETILVVEDEPALAHLICQVLKREGYETRRALTPDEATAILDDPTVDVHLLLTDMVMPGMSGRDLWLRASAARPAMRCLIMSGYARDAFEGGRPLDVPLLHKPFSMPVLIESVRSVLDAGRTAT
jgi:CheY-like chemotaxis protein/anti-sigma regulatory factor (Ser/Thr protein kinase)